MMDEEEDQIDVDVMSCVPYSFRWDLITSMTDGDHWSPQTVAVLRNSSKYGRTNDYGCPCIDRRGSVSIRTDTYDGATRVWSPSHDFPS